MVAETELLIIPIEFGIVVVGSISVDAGIVERIVCVAGVGAAGGV